MTINIYYKFLLQKITPTAPLGHLPLKGGRIGKRSSISIKGGGIAEEKKLSSKKKKIDRKNLSIKDGVITPSQSLPFLRGDVGKADRGVYT